MNKTKQNRKKANNIDKIIIQQIIVDYILKTNGASWVSQFWNFSGLPILELLSFG
jgi:hypothetical protein